MKHILIVDDEKGSRESLRMIFSKDYQLSLAENADKATKILTDNAVDVILLDIMMPDKDGITFLREIQAIYPDMPVIMISASHGVRPVVEAMKSGAFDYISKPFDTDEVRHLVQRALENRTLRRQLEVLQTEVQREFPVHGIVGQSPLFRKALENVRKAAESDSTVLIHGESGTGKELIARLIHTLSNRKQEPFVAVHCAALPESLMESELFGHEKGAFTHAETRKLGRFDLAGSGTLFFDEVSEMSQSTQVKLLRVLQEREYMRIGGTQTIRTNARIVAATAKNLGEEVRAKRYRDDLYYRLNVVPIQLPALRERQDDIPLLIHYFLHYFSQNLNVKTRDLEPETMDLLTHYPWPGNIRELRNLMERLLVLHGNDVRITPDCLPKEFHKPTVSAEHPSMTPVSLTEAVDEYERKLVLNALRESRGVQTKAAELLGTTRRILKYRMDKLNIRDSDESL